MSGLSKFVSVFLVLISLIIYPQEILADWPMAGQNNQRTSRAPDTIPSTYNRGCGMHIFSDYIPSKSHVITANFGTSQSSLVYVSTAVGVYALKSSNLANNQSDIVWFYQTTQPVGHSVTVDKNSQVLYIPSLDKTIHAVNALTGQKIWQTLKAGGGFTTNPLVANNLVYAGSRDGYLYAFRESDGSMVWAFPTDSPIDFSPAISLNNQVLYFASQNNYAYAINAVTGVQIVKSEQFQGHGFYSFWPVVHPNSTRVLFTRSLNYPETNYVDSAQHAYLLTITPTTSTQYHIDWLTQHPDMQTLMVLDATTLERRELAPYLWWGDPNGNRYPPAINSDGMIWAMSPFHADGNVGFGRGRYMGWMLGATDFTPEPGLTSNLESHDEPEAIAIFGNSIWHGDGGDGADRGGASSLSSTTYKEWWPSSLYPMVGSWWTEWNNFKYGNGISFGTNAYPTFTGTHGLQNPPVPLNGRVYIHRSNALICLEP